MSTARVGALAALEQEWNRKKATPKRLRTCLSELKLAFALYKKRFGSSVSKQTAFYGDCGRKFENASNALCIFAKSDSTWIMFALRALKAAGEDLIHEFGEFYAAKMYFYEPICALLYSSDDSRDLDNAEMHADALIRLAICRFHIALEEDAMMRFPRTFQAVYEALESARSGLELAVEAVTSSISEHRMAYVVWNGAHCTQHIVQKVLEFEADTSAEEPFNIEKALLPYINFALLCIESHVSLSTAHYIADRLNFYRLVCDLHTRIACSAQDHVEREKRLSAAKQCMARAQKEIETLWKEEKMELPVPMETEEMLKSAEDAIRLHSFCLLAPERLLANDGEDMYGLYTFLKTLNLEDRDIVHVLMNVLSYPLESKYHLKVIASFYKALEPYISDFLESKSQECEAKLDIVFPFVLHLIVLWHLYKLQQLAQLQILIEAALIRLEASVEGTLHACVRFEITVFSALYRLEKECDGNSALENLKMAKDAILNVTQAIVTCVTAAPVEDSRFLAVSIHMRQWLVDIAENLYTRFVYPLMHDKISDTELETLCELLLSIHLTFTAFSYENMELRASIAIRLTLLYQSMGKHTFSICVAEEALKGISAERDSHSFVSIPGYEESDARIKSSMRELCSMELDLCMLQFRGELGNSIDMERIRAICGSNPYLLTAFYMENLLHCKALFAKDSKACCTTAIGLVQAIVKTLGRVKKNERVFQAQKTRIWSGACDCVPPPRVLMRCSTSVTLSIQTPKNEKSLCFPHHYKVFARAARDNGSVVTLSDDHLPGTGLAVSAKALVPHIVHGLEPNKKYVFACAAYDDEDHILYDGIGKSSPAVTTLNPLQLSLMYGYLAQVCADLSDVTQWDRSMEAVKLREALCKARVEAARAACAKVVDLDALSNIGRFWDTKASSDHFLQLEQASSASVAQLNVLALSVELLSPRVQQIKDVVSNLGLRESLKCTREAMVALEMALMADNYTMVERQAIQIYNNLLPWSNLAQSSAIVFSPHSIRTRILEAQLTALAAICHIPLDEPLTEDSTQMLTAFLSFEILQTAAVLPEKRVDILALLSPTLQNLKFACNEMEALKETIILFECQQLPLRESAPLKGSTEAEMTEDLSVHETMRSLLELEKIRGPLSLSDLARAMFQKRTIKSLEFAYRLCHIAIHCAQSEEDDEEVEQLLSELVIPIKLRKSPAVVKFLSELGPFGKDFEGEDTTDEFAFKVEGEDTYVALWCGEHFYLKAVHAYHILRSKSGTGSREADENPLHITAMDMLFQGVDENINTELFSGSAESIEILTKCIDNLSLSIRCYSRARAFICLKTAYELLWNALSIMCLSPNRLRSMDDTRESFIGCMRYFIEMLDAEDTDLLKAEFLALFLKSMLELVDFHFNLLFFCQEWSALFGEYKRLVHFLQVCESGEDKETIMESLLRELEESWLEVIIYTKTKESSALNEESPKDSGAAHEAELLSFKNRFALVVSRKCKSKSALEHCYRLEAVFYANAHVDFKALNTAYEHYITICKENDDIESLVQAHRALGDAQWNASSQFPIFRKKAIKSWSECIDIAFQTASATQEWTWKIAYLAKDTDAQKLLSLHLKRAKQISRIPFLYFHAFCALGQLASTSKQSMKSLGLSLLGAHLLRHLLSACSELHPVRACDYATYSIRSTRELWLAADLFSDERALFSQQLMISTLYHASVLLDASIGPLQYAHESLFALTVGSMSASFETAALPCIVFYESIAGLHFQNLSHTINAKRMRVEALILAGKIDLARAHWDVLLIRLDSPFASLPCHYRSAITHATKSISTFPNSAIELAEYMESTTIAQLKCHAFPQLDPNLMALIYLTLLRLTTALICQVAAQNGARRSSQKALKRVYQAHNKLSAAVMKEISSQEELEVDYLHGQVKLLQIKLALSQCSCRDGHVSIDDAEKLFACAAERTHKFPVRNYAVRNLQLRSLECLFLRLCLWLIEENYARVIGFTERFIVENSEKYAGNVILQMRYLQAQACLLHGERKKGVKILYSLHKDGLLSADYLHASVLLISGHIKVADAVLRRGDEAHMLYKDALENAKAAETITEQLRTSEGSAHKAADLVLPHIVLLAAQVHADSSFSVGKDRDKVLQKIDQNLSLLLHSEIAQPCVKARLLLYKGLLLREVEVESAGTAFRDCMRCCIDDGDHNENLLRVACIELISLSECQWRRSRSMHSFQEALHYFALLRVLTDREQNLMRVEYWKEEMTNEKLESMPALVMEKLALCRMHAESDKVTSLELVRLLARAYRQYESVPCCAMDAEALACRLHAFLFTSLQSYAKLCFTGKDVDVLGQLEPSEAFLCAVWRRDIQAARRSLFCAVQLQEKESMAEAESESVCFVSLEFPEGEVERIIEIRNQIGSLRLQWTDVDTNQESEWNEKWLLLLRQLKCVLQKKPLRELGVLDSKIKEAGLEPLRQCSSERLKGFEKLLRMDNCEYQTTDNALCYFFRDSFESKS